MHLTATSCYECAKSCYALSAIIKKTKAPDFGTSPFASGSAWAAALDGAVNKQGLSIAKTEV